MFFFFLVDRRGQNFYCDPGQRTTHLEENTFESYVSWNHSLESQPKRKSLAITSQEFQQIIDSFMTQ